MKMIEVVAAVITDDKNRVFCARRKDEGELALKWEFPGGKIELNESHQEALKREIKEELSASIHVGNFIKTVNHSYQSFHLTLHAYFSTVEHGSLVLSEHVDAQWLPVSSLKDLDWAEADVPVVDYLLEHMKQGGSDDTP